MVQNMEQELLLNLSQKTNLKRNDKYVALSNLNIYFTWKDIKKSYKDNIFYSQCGMKNLNYLRGNFLYPIFNTILNRSSKNIKKWLIILQQEYK